jgi:hypothetical protein
MNSHFKSEEGVVSLSKEHIWLQERGESVDWGLASTRDLSDAGADQMVVRGVEGGVVCGVGWTGSSMRRYGGLRLILGPHLLRKAVLGPATVAFSVQQAGQMIFT